METIVINPFTDIKLRDLAPSSEGEGVYLSNLKELNVGDGGNNVFRADRNGVWLGGRTFATAPFSVSMLGAVTATSLTVTGGTMKYGKTSFTDSAHSGYYFGNEGIYFGTASDGKAIKFKISDGSFVMSGITLSWADVSGAGKPADNATAGATLGVNVSGGGTGNNQISNSGYVTTINGSSITTGTITVGSSSVGLTVNSGGDIVMNSVDGSSFSSIIFRKGSAGWDMSYVGSGGSGYNSGDLLFEPASNGQTFSIGSFALTTIGVYTHLSVYGNAYVSGSLTSGAISSLSVVPKSNGAYNSGSSSYLWANVYALNLSLAGGNYINYTGGYIQSNSQFRVVGSINFTGNMTMENYASITAKDSGGNSRVLTCQYNSTLGKYIMST